MPKVHKVLSARKARPSAGIEIGDTYYWWAFRRGGKQYSKTPPKRQQLTQSEFLKQKYEIEDAINALTVTEFADGAWESIVEQIEALAEEQGDKLSNMPDSLQSGSTGELLQEREDACTEWADTLREIAERQDWSDSPPDPANDEPEEPDPENFEDYEAFSIAREHFEVAYSEWELLSEEYDSWFEELREAFEEFKSEPCEA